MKATTQKLSSFFILFSTLACLTGFAQTSAFTYQGKLDVNGAPANGYYDFNFRLLDDPITGTAVPVIPTNLNVLVSNGLFTTAMDFGAQNITGAPQWLEINVTTNGGSTFTPLSPRQLLTTAPYAIRSLSASNLLGTLPAAQLSGTILATNLANGIITSNLLADNSVNVNQLTTNLGVWTRAGTDIFYNTGNVGVGTATPQAKFQVIGSVIGGGLSNSIAPGLIASTIAGGGVPGFPNTINSESSFIGAGNLNLIDSNLNNSFIGAGYNNTIRSLGSFIGSGNFNTISSNSPFAFVGGGQGNSIQPGASSSFIGGGNGNNFQSNSAFGFIGGGNANTIQTNASYAVLAGGYANGILPSSIVASIGGGYQNTNGGFASTVPGGTWNSALGDNSFAAGLRAKALHSGTFVWSDGEGIDFASTGNNQFLIRASGGVGIGTSNPAAPLHVVSDIPYPHLKVSAGSNAPYGAFLSMDATALPGGKEYFIFSTGGVAGEGQGKLVFQDHTDSKQLMALTTNGYVGIGTVFPAVALDVAGAIHARGGLPGPSGANNNGFMFSSPGDNDSGMSSSANGQLEFYSDSLEMMRIAQGGNVGIATNNPQSKLHVNGDITANGKIRMGTGGTNYAIDSTESLRIVRGTINSSGTIIKGNGFTVTHPGTGTYVITFTTPFADVPTVTATAVNAVVRAGAVISASSVNIGTAAFNGASTDDSFHFIAIGAQ